MTWNRSEHELEKLLKEANAWHPKIKLDYKIGQCLPFLDVLLMNNGGILSTFVYHKPAAEPYVVPFISDHPRHVFGNVVQTALARAIRYSSTFEAYQQEQRHMKLTLLYNDYPLSFINKEMCKFYLPYISLLPFLSFITNKQEFFLMRNKLLGQPTARQSQIVINAATADVYNDQTDDAQIQPTRATNKTAQQQNIHMSKLIIHYKHEKRFQPFKRDMHHLYEAVFQNTPLFDVKMIVGN